MELIVRKEKQLKVQRENFKTSLTRIKSMSLAELDRQQRERETIFEEEEERAAAALVAQKNQRMVGKGAGPWSTSREPQQQRAESHSHSVRSVAETDTNQSEVSNAGGGPAGVPVFLRSMDEVVAAFNSSGGLGIGEALLEGVDSDSDGTSSDLSYDAEDWMKTPTPQRYAAPII
jgi:hypothetical protein